MNNWKKKLHIWRKICRKIRIVKKDEHTYVVEHKNVDKDWHELNQFSSHSAALNKKHVYIVMILLRDMGYRNDLVKKRTVRKAKSITHPR
jgi:hypothetical protein